MTYLPNIPLPTDLLSKSQGDILNNFTSSNNVFGIDHYKFDDATANKGKHNTVTTPLIVGAVHPVTAAAEPKFYGMQDTANLGVLQYSRGASNAVPSPVTSLQSPSAAITLANAATTNILDFTGITDRAICKVFAADFTAASFSALVRLKNESTIYWNGAAFFIPGQTSVDLKIQATGNILQIINNSGGALNNIYWTMQIMRVEL
jgi:hypothetical protein